MSDGAPRVRSEDYAGEGVGHRPEWVRGAVALTISQFLGPALQVIQLAALALLLSPSQFGDWTLPIALYGAAAILFEVALPAAFVAERQRSLVITALWGAGAVSVIAGAGGWLLLQGSDSANYLFGLVPAVVLLAANCSSRATLSAAKQFGTMAKSELVAAAASVGVAIASASLGAGTWALVLSTGFRQTYITLIQGRASRALGELPCGKPRVASLAAFYGLVYLSLNLDYLYAGRLLSPHDAGIYLVAFNAATLLVLRLVTVANRVSLPLLTGLDDVNRRQAAATYMQLSLAVAGVCGIVQWSCLLLLRTFSIGVWTDTVLVAGWIVLGSVGMGISAAVATMVISVGGRWRLTCLAVLDVGLMTAAVTATRPETAVQLAQITCLVLTLRGALWLLLAPPASLRVVVVRSRLPAVFAFTGILAPALSDLAPIANTPGQILIGVLLSGLGVLLGLRVRPGR